MAGTGRKPDITIGFKAVNASKETKDTPFAAFWSEDGRLGGGLDKRVAQVKIQLEDGTVVHIKRENGKLTHWCNAKDWRDGPRRSSGGGGRRSEPQGDTDDGEIPF